MAHGVLADLYNPQYQAIDAVSRDSTRVHSLAAVRCDSLDGNHWIRHWMVELEQGDAAAAKSALTQLDRSGLIAPAWRAHARWVLGGLPERAILLVAGDMDTYPVVIEQEVHGLRRDVVVMNVPMLNLTWYRELLSARYAISFPDVDTTYSDPSEGPADRVIAIWRAQAASGALDRPLAAALSLGEAATLGPGVPRFAGAYYVIAGEGTAVLDEALNQSFSIAESLDWSGPQVTELDRSPIRRASGVHPALMVGFAAAIAEELRNRPDPSLARWARAFLARSGVPAEQIRQYLPAYAP